MSVRIRPGKAGDVESLRAMYNHYVTQVTEVAVTFDVDPISAASMREWFEGFAGGGNSRLLVADGEGGITGYAFSKPFRPKPAYERSVESTIYVAPNSQARGIGGQLYARLFEELEGEGVHRVYARIALPNPQSTGFHERSGFRRVGVLTEVGWKFGKYWDTALYEKALA